MAPPFAESWVISGFKLVNQSNHDLPHSCACETRCMLRRTFGRADRERTFFLSARKLEGWNRRLGICSMTDRRMKQPRLVLRRPPRRRQLSSPTPVAKSSAALRAIGRSSRVSRIICGSSRRNCDRRSPRCNPSGSRARTTSSTTRRCDSSTSGSFSSCCSSMASPRSAARRASRWAPSWRFASGLRRPCSHGARPTGRARGTRRPLHGHALVANRRIPAAHAHARRLRSETERPPRLHHGDRALRNRSRTRMDPAMLRAA